MMIYNFSSLEVLRVWIVSNAVLMNIGSNSSYPNPLPTHDGYNNRIITCKQNGTRIFTGKKTQQSFNAELVPDNPDTEYPAPHAHQ